MQDSTLASSILQLYMYQLMRSLAYIHSLGICHRDIKPQNLLLDPETGVLKLCDFGSAKHLVRGEPNVSYICSRYYRAPELIFGATDYTTQIGTLGLHNHLWHVTWRQWLKHIHSQTDSIAMKIDNWVWKMDPKLSIFMVCNLICFVSLWRNVSFFFFPQKEYILDLVCFLMGLLHFILQRRGV